MISSFKNITVTQEHNILLIVINRPKNLNALNKLTLLEFERSMMSAYSDDSIKGIIITGAGDKAFIAGADIKEFKFYSNAQGKEMVENGQRVLKLIEDCPKPTIAAVNGYALGGGCELAMACHLRIGTDNAKFGLPEVKLGIIPGYGGTQRLHQLVGKSKAMELLLTGGTINAEEAEKIGLLNYIVSSDTLLTKALELLTKILNNSPVAIKSIIKATNAYYTFNVDGFNTEIQEFKKCFGSSDFDEGTDAFISKRKPNFNG
jgi:enoyl-CoA hydratase